MAGGQTLDTVRCKQGRDLLELAGIVRGNDKALAVELAGHLSVLSAILFVIPAQAGIPLLSVAIQEKRGPACAGATINLSAS
ncbi:hypothetical protein GCM10011349_31520 [Novosphingobium indicum]|uniref:Uncharacterized protein n=1 Tax=Novosphingobium indicum TaxID=462949 RepID=A0ABQ2JVA5_9SPHN|nr:hypothetical protein GCM10011349_31520 [Novosphingobium indicum]